MKYYPTEEEYKEIQELSDPDYFEIYCSSCIYFETDNCPFKGKVFDATDYREIKCNKFND